MKQLLKIILGLPLLLLLSFCGGVTGGSTATGGDAATVDTLSNEESGLYDDGPLNMPVTIAKIDSIDSDDISVEFSDSGIPESVRSLAVTTGSGYTITVAAGGVHDPVVTPKILVGNISTDSTITVTAETDGSASFTIPASEGDIVYLAPMTADELNIAPPVYVSVQNGVVAKFYTNSATIGPQQNILSHDGYLYFSATSFGATTTNLYRRNLDGSALETVATGIPADMILYIAFDGNNYIFIDSLGRVWRIAATTVAGSLSDTLFGDASPLFTTTWAEPEEIYDMGVLPSFNAALAVDGNQFAKVFQASTGDIFITRDRHSSSTEVNSGLLTHIDPNTGTATTLIASDDYEVAVFDGAGDDVVYALVKGNEGTFSPHQIVRLDLTNGVDAWTQREAVEYSTGTLGLTYESSVGTFDISENAVGVLSLKGSDSNGTIRFFVIELNQIPRLVYTYTDGNVVSYQSQFVRVSPDTTTTSGYFIACEGGTSSYFSLLPLDGTSTTFYKVDNTLIGYDCSRQFDMDADGHLVFYSRLDGDTTNPLQVTVIDIASLDITALPVDE